MSLQKQWSAIEPRRLARLALLLLVLCAFGAQQWIAQTHWHAGAVAEAAAPDEQGGEHRHHDCLGCQIAAHAGAAGPPSALRLLVPVRDQLFVLLPAGIDAGIAAPPAYAWRSRGPPSA